MATTKATSGVRTIGTDEVLPANIMDNNKGADIASGTTVIVGTDGMYQDITGTTGPIGTYTVAAGRQFIHQFDAAATVTHSATIALAGAVDFVAAAGDRVAFFAVAANTVVEVSRTTVGLINATDIKPQFIPDFTEVVVAVGDSILLGDASDSGNTKRDTVQGILDLVPSVPAGLEFVEAVTFSGVTTFDIGETLLTAGYTYCLELLNVKFSTAALGTTQMPYMQFGTGVGPTYQTTGYISYHLSGRAGALLNATGSTTRMDLAWANGLGGSTNEFWGADIVIPDPGASNRTIIRGQWSGNEDVGTNLAVGIIGGSRTTTEVITGLRIGVGTGTFLGTAILRRKKNSA